MKLLILKVIALGTMLFNIQQCPQPKECTTTNCLEGEVLVFPYYNGTYQLPAVPIRYYYIRVNKDDNRTLWVYFSQPDGIFCDIDIPRLQLKCCAKYDIELFVKFDGPLEDRLLDKVSIVPENNDGCFIFDADPNFN